MAQFKSARKVLDLMTANKGTIKAHSDAETVKLMTDAGLEPYKLPTYIWHIRHKFNIPVTVTKNGRFVTAYSLDTAVSVPATGDAADTDSPATQVEA